MPENLLPLEDPSKKIPIPETAGLVLAALGLFAVISSGSKTGKGTEEKIPSPAVHSITARQVGKSFSGRAILSGFDLSVSAGECVVLWGANGAGKSTFLKCLLGLMDFEGAVEIFGRDVRAQGKKARKFIGYLPQELTGYDWTVRQTLEFVCQVRQVDFSAIPPILEDCLLAGEEDKKVPALSGGMKQKLALALALIADPAVLVLDEPCSNLDLKSRREFLEVLKGLKGTRTLLVTSHRLDEVLALADRVVVMEEGLPVRELEHVEDVRLEDLA
ncbi:MAG: hypothetical protein A2901_07000 [Elusimicrobia bacterium RIFCSPLOWO2_01_FULL_54_10]|nr:MAG: hypothetical protein A2901_07000 [Elusimicrobia bacterium RIFCSPLOWO2_01_FULL_54_10]